MSNKRLAKRYAQAFYDFAEENQKVDTIYNDICLLYSTYKENNELQVVMESPIINFDKKNKIFQALFQDHLEEITYRFLRLIVQKRREPQLEAIMEHYIHIYYEKHNIREAYLTTAQPLSDEMRQEIKTLLENETQCQIVLHEKVNPTLIGGILIRIDDFLLDATILSRINKLKNEFKQNQYKAAF